MSSAQFTWLGTAGFSIKTPDSHILVDPYLTRNTEAIPHQPLSPRELVDRLGPAQAIFVTHGHFDHIWDIPALAALNPGASIHCDAVPARTLENLGVPAARLQPVAADDPPIAIGDITARARAGRHIKFDLPLVGSTLKRMGWGFYRHLHLFRNYPCGHVIAWRFNIQGKDILFFGSAGATDDELDALKREPIHTLMLPLQGHSMICDLAARQVERLSPQRVIPHHMDDYHPPVSQTVDINPFLNRLKQSCPEIEIQVPEFNTPMPL